MADKYSKNTLLRVVSVTSYYRIETLFGTHQTAWFRLEMYNVQLFLFRTGRHTLSAHYLPVKLPAAE